MDTQFEELPESKQIGVRLDRAMLVEIERIKQDMGYKTDSDAVRYLIAQYKTKETLIAEIEGRLLEKFIPILEARQKEYYSTEEYKNLIRALMDEVISENEDTVDDARPQ